MIKKMITQERDIKMKTLWKENKVLEPLEHLEEDQEMDQERGVIIKKNWKRMKEKKKLMVKQQQVQRIFVGEVKGVDQDFEDQQVKEDPKDNRDLKESQDHKAILDHRDLWDHKDHEGIRDLQDL